MTTTTSGGGWADIASVIRAGQSKKLGIASPVEMWPSVLVTTTPLRCPKVVRSSPSHCAKESPATYIRSGLAADTARIVRALCNGVGLILITGWPGTGGPGTVGVGPSVGVGGIGVAVGGTRVGVAVGVAVGGSGVTVGSTVGVAVGSTGVAGSAATALAEATRAAVAGGAVGATVDVAAPPQAVRSSAS